MLCSAAFLLGFYRSISQNSSVLHEEEDERSCSESDTQLSQRLSVQHPEEVTGFLLPPGVLASGICLHGSLVPDSICS